MKDIIKPFDIFVPKIKIPKHGYTKIELKDPYTGHKQTFESENMMTKGVEEFYSNLGLLNTLPSDFLGNKNVVTTLLGGVMLFDDEIPENANNTSLPTANMTANMAYGLTNNTNPQELGSYSSTESGWQQDGSFVQVYDFTTTQGNGDIASACLTSQRMGGIGAGNGSGTNKEVYPIGYHTGSYYYIETTNPNGRLFFKIDEENSVGYAVAMSEIGMWSAITGGGTIHVYKYLLPLSTIDVRGMRLLETYTYTLPSDFTFRDYYYKNRGVFQGKFALFGCSSNAAWSSSNPLKVLLIDETGIEYHTISTPPVEGLWYYASNNNGYIFNGCIYIARQTSSSNCDPTTVYKIRLSDGALVSTISIAGISYNDWTYNPYWMLGEKQIAKRYNTGWIFNFDNDTFKKCNIASSNSFGSGEYLYTKKAIYRNDPSNSSSNVSSNLRALRNYYKIMSINNLDSVVTKTPDKTMKVTYRITF